MIKLIIFDWDDVFTLNSKGGYFQCLRESINELGVFLSEDEERKRILSKWGRPHREELGALLKERPELLGKACKLYEGKFFGNTFTNALGYVDGANELLERLNKNYILALATGAHPEVLKEKVMKHFKTPQVFSQIISGYELDNASQGKPSPYMTEKIMETQGASPKETIVVGDAKTDMMMAKNAGVIPIAVLTGHMNKTDAEELSIKYILDDVTELEKVLEELNSNI